jgi:hypothetical protein
MFFRKTPHPAPVPPAVITPEVKTSIATALRRLSYFDRAYDLGLLRCSTRSTYLDDLRHDFEIALAYNDLKSVRIELTDSNKVVGASFRISFDGQGLAGAPRKDSAALETPLIDRTRFSGKRLLVTGIHQPSYAKQLRLNWSTAETYRMGAGSTFASDFTARSSNGLTQGEFFADRQSIHLMEIVNSTPDGPYAFARSLTLGNDTSIFVVKAKAPGLDLSIGRKVKGLVVMTPRGLQARALEAV